MTPRQENIICYAYLGIRVLEAMCRKVGLTLAVDRARDLTKELENAFPFIGAPTPKRTTNCPFCGATPVQPHDPNCGHAQRFPTAASLRPKGEEELVVWLRLLDAGTDNACWVVCNKVDHGAIAFGVKTNVCAP